MEITLLDSDEEAKFREIYQTLTDNPFTYFSSKVSRDGTYQAQTVHPTDVLADLKKISNDVYTYLGRFTLRHETPNFIVDEQNTLPQAWAKYNAWYHKVELAQQEQTSCFVRFTPSLQHPTLPVKTFPMTLLLRVLRPKYRAREAQYVYQFGVYDWEGVLAEGETLGRLIRAAESDYASYAHDHLVHQALQQAQTNGISE